jgi:uncharacterized protein
MPPLRRAFSRSAVIHPEQEEVIRAMLQPETYPEPPTGILHLQTHISHLFLTGRLVYKIKKPVDLGFLDFTTLARRHYFCGQEVLLNRRLTKDLYLGVVKIAASGEKIRINGPGRVLEYAVLMREMPQERMMDHLLAAGRVTQKDLRALVRKLVPFYQKAKTGKGIDPFGRIEIIVKNTEENFLQTHPYVGRLISVKEADRLHFRCRAFLKRNPDLFQKRIQEGRIRDCHGDLHSGNICLEENIQIYDCIEFNHRFRYADIASDLAFLAMDLDFYGPPDLSELLIREYTRLSGDRDLPRLLHFYKTYRAHVRAKVHAFAADDLELPAAERESHSRAARKYFRLAVRYALQLPVPQLVVVFGLMGTGKTTLAQALATRTGWTLFSSDAVRKKLGGIPPTTKKWEPFGGGIYGEEMSRRTYDRMREGAGKELQRGKSVILDGSYKRQSERQALIDLAEQLGAEIRFIECRAPVKIIRQRLEQRSREKEVVSDGRWELYRQQRRDFDPVEGPVKAHSTRVPVLGSVEKMVDTIFGVNPNHV